MRMARTPLVAAACAAWILVSLMPQAHVVEAASTAEPKGEIEAPGERLQATGERVEVRGVRVTFEEMLRRDAELRERGTPSRRPAPWVPHPGPVSVEVRAPGLSEAPAVEGPVTLQEEGTDEAATPGSRLREDGGAEKAAVPPLLESFAGLHDTSTGQFGIPPDTHGAAGPNHLASILNTGYAVFDKDTGSIVGSAITLDAFWSELCPNPPNDPGCDPFDPKILYDQHSGRWIVTADSHKRSALSHVLFAISESSDPTAGYIQFAIEADSTDVTWADYPGFGVDERFVTITNNMFTVSDDTFERARFWVIDKADALGETLTVTVFDADEVLGVEMANQAGFTWQPTHTFGSHATSYLVSEGWSAGTDQFLRLLSISDDGGDPVLADEGFIQVASYEFGQDPAPQDECSVEIATNDTRLLNAVQRDGRIWTTHSVADGSGQTQVAWYELDPAEADPGLAGTPIQQGRIADQDLWFSFPSITVNAAECVALGFSGTSSTTFIGGYYTLRTCGDDPGFTEIPGVLKAGEDSYRKTFGAGENRWGDYSATTVDPVDDLTFWTIQEYARPEDSPGCSSADDTGHWGTWWGSFSCGETICVCATDDDCDDGIACTTDTCDSGACSNVPDDSACSDGASCTADSCAPTDPDADPANGCLFEPNDAACDDGATCTADACAPGEAGADGLTGCVNTADDTACDDGFACTTDACDPASGSADGTTGCVVSPDDGACDDGLFCTGTETCDPADGQADGEGCVSSGDPCQAEEVCDEDVDQCEPAPDCTEDLDCDDGFACTADACVEGSCQNTPQNPACEDGLFCTGTETCDPQSNEADGAGCVSSGDPCAQEETCDETADQCEPAVDCTVDADCDDQSACTTDSCVEGACQNVPVDCDDGIACTTDTCDDQAGCVNTASDAFCDDGAFCNGAETCAPQDAGADAQGCVESPDRCTDPGEGCLETEQRCQELLCGDQADNDDDALIDCDDLLDCGPDDDGDGFRAPPCGNDCDDGDSSVNPGRGEDCTTPEDDDCDSLVNCADDDCQVDADGDGQVAQPCGNDCDDGNDAVFQGATEICDDGLDNDCDGLTDCADDDCLGTPCDDGIACTTGDVCTAGGCAGTPQDIACDDGLSCTDDSCVAGVGCESTAVDGRCVDTRFCNGTETCQPGASEADPVTGCLAGVSPCGSSLACDEEADQCLCPNDLFEPDDTCAEARPVTVDATLRHEGHSLCPAGDRDRIRFEAVEGRQYRFFTTGTTDTLGIVTDGSCLQQLARNNDCSASDANFCILWRAPFSGPAVLTVLSGAGQANAEEGRLLEGKRPVRGAKGTLSEEIASGGKLEEAAEVQADEQGIYTLFYQVADEGCDPDLFEPEDDSCSLATFITPRSTPTSEIHSLCPPGDVDRWRFLGEAGVTYRFRTTGGLDTFSRIRTDDCSVALAANGSCDGGPDSCLEFTPVVTAFYTVEVLGQNLAQTGTYQFVHEREGAGEGCDPDTAEPDGGCGQAAPIVVTTTEQVERRTLCPEDDRDGFRFFAEAGRIYSFFTEGGRDTRIELTSGDCVVTLAEESSCGEDPLDACLHWRADRSGPVKVFVTADDPTVTGPYTFHHLQSPCPVDAFEPDGSCAGASPLVVTTELQREAHTICPPGESDLWEFFAQEGVTYRFFSRGSTDMGGAVLDGTCGRFLVKDESSGEGENFDLLWTAPATGIFKLGATGDGGPYDLFHQRVADPGPSCVTDGAEPDDVCAQGTVIVPGPEETTHERSLCPPDDRDHFTFEAEAGVTYRFWTTGDTDTAGNIRDAGCTKLVGNDDCDLPDDLNFCLTWEAPADGVYHLRVRGFSRSQTVGGYVLHGMILP